MNASNCAFAVGDTGMIIAASWEPTVIAPAMTSTIMDTVLKRLLFK